MTKEKIFSDLADLAGGAASMFSAFRDQMRNDVKDRMDEIAERLDLVTRADIARLEGMIEKLRVRIDAMEKYDSKSESKVAPKPAAKKQPMPSPKKPTAKSPAPKPRTKK